jgi:hypothetical protein
MVLQASYSSQSEVPESLKSEYKEKDGIWVLDGFVPKNKVDEYRSNNISLTKEREALKTQLLKFKDIDPAKYAEAVNGLQELENKRLEDAGEWKVLKANLEQQHSDTVKTEKARAKTIQDGWNKERIANQVAMTVTKFAVPAEGNMKYIQADIQSVTAIDPDTNQIVFLNDKGLKVMNEAGDAPLSMDEYLTKIYIPKSNLFQKSEGSGAMGGFNIPTVSQGQVSIDSINGREIPESMISDLASGKLKAV